MAQATRVLPECTIEHDGMLWKPKRGATAAPEEFIGARTLIIDLHREGRWNPWVLDDRAPELERAMQVMEQWRRAEPGHRMLTTKQVEARTARQDREREHERAKRAKEREARAAHYVPERAEARLALLEQQSRLQYDRGEVAGFMDGSRYPGMDPTRRQKEIAKLEQSIERRAEEIERLRSVVGDPEDVVDEHGWLPRECRDRMLAYYTCERQSEVRKLRQELPNLETELKAATDRNERYKLRNRTIVTRRRLDELLAVPPLTSDEMCSECPTPTAKHGWVTPPFEGPCPAWPGWAARLRRAGEILETAARHAERPAEPPVPKPEPLAIIPSGLPIAEVTQRLMELQKQYPDAEVRRGRANRWELWQRESQ